MSETNACRDILSKYCVGIGLDIGFGGSAITPTAITFDMPRPYTRVGSDRQVLRGDCRNLNFICDDSLDYIYSSHLLEDFTYKELDKILREWRRVLKPDGLLVINCPNQQTFLAHCQATGQPVNLAHKEQDFSCFTFLNVALKVGNWEIVFSMPEFGSYSFLLVLRKIT